MKYLFVNSQELQRITGESEHKKFTIKQLDWFGYLNKDRTHLLILDFNVPQGQILELSKNEAFSRIKKYIEEDKNKNKTI